MQDRFLERPWNQYWNALRSAHWFVSGVKSMSTESEFQVVCLCAEWCGTCRDYRPGFESLAGEFPEMLFRWVDIEEQAEEMGDLDIENFPTLLIGRGDLVLFFGTMLPHLGHLRRTLEVFLEQSAEESWSYASSAADRRAWQSDADLRRLCNDE